MRIFTENQKFNQWWVLLLIYGLFLVSTVGILHGIATISEENLADFFIGIVPPFLILGLISAALFTTTLKTRIDEKGIYYGFSPFQKKLQLAPWEEIEAVYIRKYKPLSEFGGWGYKFSMKGNGKVYNTKGNMGIQIVFKDGKKTLVGTQHPDEASQVIKNYTSKTT
ncbi:MAG: hypothetical protein CMC70_07500 [Flavobacteriaceae bacterium]|nr:hypothetical protein [Flavobacteriaceae bacterium]|tara:strand:- start:3 stop:503 length:501 start_codon:yes stop_codon:yes gene_type:complete